MIKKNKKLGFSLLELSITILLISVALLAISKGRIVFIQSKVNFSQDFTTKSPVILTKDLIAWYEPVLTTSFNEIDKYDGTVLTNVDGSSWNDSSPSGENHAVIGVAPKYEKYAINDLPAVRFDGTASSLVFDHSDLIQKHFTVFIVEQRLSSGINHLMTFGGESNLGYIDDITIGGIGITTPAAVSTFSGAEPRILTFLSADKISHTKGVFINGGSGSVAADDPADALINDQITGSIGYGFIVAEAFYDGNISEIIIFNRALNLDERNRIQKYLGKKYNITTTDSI
ncbi:MAG: prepilin-type N-terminal cleavage/methylation domain-containing protein [Rickettsiales bacterium]|jgi:prepilin-type N-terminal cleavage/methylation domain-containing protein